ncbi:GAP1-N2 domain-containing protein [Tuwongella immobilis]|uniref:GTPase-associated protein 1 N-terminal domain-containing protein n=1 Tax=Tuwongella immobilis TaxID=692036 RepID=A0A6C2YXC5_9BACT|nr:hypothetical protein [Tuwongella immobilis]VIP05539.1 unnamed protein product [Tuwongella immobilis]VTS08434.1 unnamed protein product [Tuwongella immobilis]
MSEPVPRLTARQLVYTNVEADRSPTRRRGFQLWLVDADLPEVIRREVSRRLEDFRLPNVPCEDESAVKRLTRWAFFPVSNGTFGIARTVPLLEKDRFGRGGRFHAHALLFEEAELAKIGFQVFRVIDSAFVFQNSPHDLPADFDLRKGELPPAELEPALDVVPKVPSELVDRYLEFAQWLPMDDDRTLALPVSPEDAERWLRYLFGMLPADYRKRCSFDTLNSGQTLMQTRFKVAAAFDATSLRRWVYRRYITWEPNPPGYRPPLEPVNPTDLQMRRLRLFAESPRTTDAIAELDRYARLVEAADLAELQAAPPPESIWADLGRLGALAVAWPKLAATRLARDLIPELAALPHVQRSAMAYLQEGGAENWIRLAEPIPPAKIDHWVADAWEAMREPFPDLWREPVRQWLTERFSDDRQKLELMFARWHRSEGSLRRLWNEPASEPFRDWFRRWVLQTLPPEFRDSTGEYASILNAADLLDRLLDSVFQRHWNAVHVTDSRPIQMGSNRGILEFLVLMGRGKIDDAKSVLRDDPPIREWLETWLWEQSTDEGWRAVIDYDACTMRLVHLYSLEIRHRHHALVGAIAATLLDSPANGLMTRALEGIYRDWPSADVVEALPGTHPAVQELNRWTIHANADHLAKCAAWLQRQEDRLFAMFVNELLLPTLGPAMLESRVASTASGVSLKFGLQIQWTSNQTHSRPAFYLASAVASLMPLALLEPGASEKEYVDLSHPQLLSPYDRLRRIEWLLLRVLRHRSMVTPPRLSRLS